MSSPKSQQKTRFPRNRVSVFLLSASAAETAAAKAAAATAGATAKTTAAKAAVAATGAAAETAGAAYAERFGANDAALQSRLAVVQTAAEALASGQELGLVCDRRILTAGWEAGEVDALFTAISAGAGIA